MRNNLQEDGVGTVVGANVKLQGTLKDTNDIAVHGIVEGEVISNKTIFISETAAIKGPIIGEIVTVAGTVKGSIDAKDKLEILATGKVSGSINSNTLIINAGAQFNGKSTMAVATPDTLKEENDKTETKTTHNSVAKESETVSDKNETDSDFELE